LQPAGSPAPWKRIARWAVGFGFSALFLYLALRGTDLPQVLQLLGQTRLPFAVAAVLFLMLSFVSRAWRWRYLLLPVKPVPVRLLFQSTMIGFMANYLLPLRAGEVIRAVSIGQGQSLSKAAALGSLVVERLLDGITLASIPFVLVIALDVPRWITWWSLLLLSLFIAGLMLTVLKPARAIMQSLSKRLFGVLPQALSDRLGSIAQRFFQGMEGLNRTSVLLPVALLSLFCWLFHAMYYFLLFAALDLHLSFWAALLLEVMIGVGVSVPAGPAYVGNFEYAAVLGLGLLGISKEHALSYSLLAHSLQAVAVTVIGLFFAFRARTWPLKAS
jgi:glycosyltransferase 2 family protein